MFRINVRFSAACSCIVHVNTNDTVSEIKSKISEEVKISEKNIQLILAGKVLKDEDTLKDLNVGDATTIYGFNQPHSQDLNGKVDALDFSLSEVPKHRYEYYVYCSKCKGLRPGKLRVRCQSCDEGQIILEKEPDCFDDVLIKGRIQGVCQSEKCQGQQQNVVFYFKCTEEHEGEVAAVLRHIKLNRKKRECLTCSEVMPQVIVYPCMRQHVMCLECFKTYCIVKLNDRSFVQDINEGYSLPCPIGCENSLLKDAHHFSLMGKEQYDRYKNFAAEEYVLQNGGILCPSAFCGAGFIPDDTSNRHLICPACDYSFCKTCLTDYHEMDECRASLLGGAVLNNTFAGNGEQALRAAWDLPSLETIDRISKPCPQCNTKTEKDGGCMHMTCTRCRFDWCWICEKEWNYTCQGEHWFG